MGPVSWTRFQPAAIVFVGLGLILVQCYTVKAVEWDIPIEIGNFRFLCLFTITEYG
jgi:hypothetical protein